MKKVRSTRITIALILCLTFLFNPFFGSFTGKQLNIFNNSLSDNNIPYTEMLSMRDINTDELFTTQNSQLNLTDSPITVIYNISSGKEAYISESSSLAKLDLSNTLSSAPYVGLFTAERNDSSNPISSKPELLLKNIIDSDDREEILSTSSFPWRTICKLLIKASDFYQFFGTGVVIDEFHVLTCGHNVYIAEHGGWVKSIQVIPAINDESNFCGYAWAKYMRTYASWTAFQDSRDDWAVLTLDRKLGQYTGWMGRLTADYTSSIYNETLITAGYPLDISRGNKLCYDSAKGDRADQYNHWYYLDTYDGQSGSPVWVNLNGSNYIISIHTNSGSGLNMGTRLNYNKFDTLNEWLNLDVGLTPQDFPDIEIVGEPFAGFTLLNDKHRRNLSIWCDIRNIGSNTSGAFTVSYYISSDDNITSDDYLIGTDLITSMYPYSSRTSIWEGKFPGDIPNGRYFIGFVLHSNITELGIDGKSGLVSSRVLEVGILDPFVILAFFLLGVISLTSIYISKKRRRNISIKSSEIESAGNSPQ